ncbi:MAG: hypothetical protein C4316_13445 [Chloroflexota bacterium]
MELLTVLEVARRLRISRSLAYLLVVRGEIPAIRIGKLIRVPADALEAWIAAHTRGGKVAEMEGPAPWEGSACGR